MRKRLYFVLPNKRLAQNIERELLLRLVEADQIGFMAKVDSDLGDLIRPGPMQWSGLRHAIKVGVLAGGLTGAILGLLLNIYAAPQAGLNVILLMTLGGAAFGAWMQSMIVSVPDTRLQTILRDIRDGQILLMLDVVEEKVEAASQIVARWHPAGIADAVPGQPSINTRKAA